jgi:hypothetical protein
MAEYIDNVRFHKLIVDYHERKKINPKEKIPEEARKNDYHDGQSISHSLCF